MLVDENKRFLISSFCSSTSICTLKHCYLCPWRLVANHLFSLYLQNEASQGTKLCNYFHFYSIYNIRTHSFQNRILPMPFRDFREMGLRTLCISDVCTIIFLFSSIDVIDVTASEADKNNDSVSIQVKTTKT